MSYSCDQKTQQLVALAQRGDESALERLYYAYGERVRWMIRLRMGKELRPKLDSMDIVQDALTHALNGIKDFTYQNEGDFVRWLSKIAENALHDNWDRFHAEKRDVRKEIPLGNDGYRNSSRFSGIPGPIATTTPSVIFSKKEDLNRLEKAIDLLKPEYKEVIIMTKIEGLGYQEIADRVGKSSEAVRKLVSRAMTALINAFEGIK